MLILVRHAQPIIDSNKPSAEWQLSADGRNRSRELAEQLRTYQPDIVITSREPKAAETGRIIAETLGLPYETAENLHEHRRTGEFVGQEKFQQQVRGFFERPTELVFGLETAEQALERFETAVSQVIGRHPNKNIIIASLPFWQELQLTRVWCRDCMQS
jgi:broad specificity phosphatase PhoE